MAKAGARPVVDIYSTFLQRSYDQIFQEVALQNLPVVFCLDRAGLVGADGPTHHGTYDLSYLRVFPNMVVMAPGDEKDIAPMFAFALRHTSPVAIRYPRANLDTIDREVQPVELGQAEILEWETDGMLLACGAMVGSCLRVATLLRNEYGMRVGVVNARFVGVHEAYYRGDHLRIDMGGNCQGGGSADGPTNQAERFFSSTAHGRILRAGTASSIFCSKTVTPFEPYRILYADSPPTPSSSRTISNPSQDPLFW